MWTLHSQHTNLLECLALGLWEEQVRQDGITEVASHENEKESPSNSIEGERRDLGDEDVVEPIAGGRSGSTKSSKVHGEDLGLVDPRDCEVSECPHIETE
jgi:hypothetical protein